MTLGEKIRALRKEKRYSIMNIRELTGLSKSTISEIENDKSSPTAETLQKIANALEVTVDTFFKDDDHDESLSQQNIEFTTPQEAMEFILKQPSIMGYGGFDISKMSDEEIVEFANELLRQLQLISYKYKK
ncbi:helix-turn-helix domain-containing protein [Alkaliphilus oremlandii]|uniref:Transcriptional regulator, XRE family n=1 Tax=Alkaliphilus oremlandii (strain OhILAs) TaxID=350688 RepID=A8MGA3_ALKOO|nr:helix-turn-helix transcriptional regulator [Alkaliphilus oremlandii]ABW18831.1 transcriptional regulator, XRE family [Alkaliphilus oremlandii OhILAs]